MEILNPYMAFSDTSPVDKCVGGACYSLTLERVEVQAPHLAFAGMDGVTVFPVVFGGSRAVIF